MRKALQAETPVPVLPDLSFARTALCLRAVCRAQSPGGTAGSRKNGRGFPGVSHGPVGDPSCACGRRTLTRPYW